MSKRFVMVAAAMLASCGSPEGGSAPQEGGTPAKATTPAAPAIERPELPPIGRSAPKFRSGPTTEPTARDEAVEAAIAAEINAIPERSRTAAFMLLTCRVRRSGAPTPFSERAAAIRSAAAEVARDPEAGRRCVESLRIR